jgi:hypothetical protein
LELLDAYLSNPDFEEHVKQLKTRWNSLCYLFLISGETPEHLLIFELKPSYIHVDAR